MKIIVVVGVCWVTTSPTMALLLPNPVLHPWKEIKRNLFPHLRSETKRTERVSESPSKCFPTPPPHRRSETSKGLENETFSPPHRRDGPVRLGGLLKHTEREGDGTSQKAGEELHEEAERMLQDDNLKEQPEIDGTTVSQILLQDQDSKEQPEINGTTVSRTKQGTLVIEWATDGSVDAHSVFYNAAMAFNLGSTSYIMWGSFFTSRMSGRMRLLRFLIMALYWFVVGNLVIRQNTAYHGVGTRLELGPLRWVLTHSYGGRAFQTNEGAMDRLCFSQASVRAIVHGLPEYELNLHHNGAIITTIPMPNTSKDSVNIASVINEHIRRCHMAAKKEQ